MMSDFATSTRIYMLHIINYTLSKLAVNLRVDADERGRHGADRRLAPDRSGTFARLVSTASLSFPRTWRASPSAATGVGVLTQTEAAGRFRHPLIAYPK